MVHFFVYGLNSFAILSKYRIWYSGAVSYTHLDVYKRQNQYIALRCRAKTMEIMTYFLFAMVAGCMIGYGITKDTAFLWLLIGAGIPFGVLQIVSIVLGLYYERNQ